MSSYSTEIPIEITAGNSINFAIKAYDSIDNELVSGASYTLYWVISNESTQYSATTQTQVDQGFLFELAYADTSGWTAGNYSSVVYADDGTDRYEQTKAFVTILPSLDTAVDARSSARKIRDALDAAILGSATSNQLAMSIAGRSIQRMSLDDLIKAKTTYDSLVASEDRAQDIKDGKASSNTIRTRFVR